MRNQLVRNTRFISTEQSEARLSSRGAALLEVLMAMGVMAIGVLSVMTLFPLSVRKALEASQKTNASILKWQFEQLLTTNPQILPINDRTIHVPGDNTNNLFPRSPANGANAGIGTLRIRVTDPRGRYARNTTLYAPIIDLYEDANNNGVLNGGEDIDSDGQLDLGALGTGAFTRTYAGFYRNEAENFTTLQDSWNTHIDFFLTSAITINADDAVISFPGGETILNAVSEIPATAPANPKYRLLISDPTGKQYQVRGNILRTGANQLTVSPSLPAIYANSLTCRLQVFDPRYSWMVTTKTTLKGYGPDNLSGTADDIVETDATLVIFFRRSMSDLTEEPFSGSNLSADQTQIEITAPIGIPIKVDAGSYIFDAETGEWYQAMVVTGSNPYVVSLDKPFYIRPGFPTPHDKLVIYENIMGVYPLGRFWTGL